MSSLHITASPSLLIISSAHFFHSHRTVMEIMQHEMCQARIDRGAGNKDMYLDFRMMKDYKVELINESNHHFFHGLADGK
ncbi:hypothetical protein Tco_1454130 [Tanacetum coccineum]